MLSPYQNLAAAYAHCMDIAQNHYENFPVASRLLNNDLRYPVSAVYAFARTADDFADEGDLSEQQRLQLLDEYSTELRHIEEGHIEEESHISHKLIFIALADVIKRYHIPIGLFYDLLSAFKSDVSTHRYENFEQLLTYCQNSANPVGRILLYLNHSASEENLIYSDAICSALQLINFYQDIAQDIDENDRLYIPLDEIESFSLDINDIRNKINNEQTQALMTFQLQRTKLLLKSGKPLCFNLSGRFALEIRMIYCAAHIILEKLEQQSASIYLRPRLSRLDKIKILGRGLFFK